MTTRWFVEVSPVDADTLKERYCVEALQWQQALQQARKLRGDKGPLSRFSIELLEAGYRATDPSVRLRYTVSKAPGDAPLTGIGTNGSGTGHAVPAAAVLAAPSASAAVGVAAIAPAIAAAVVPVAAAPQSPSASVASAAIGTSPVVDSGVPRPSPPSSSFRAVGPASARSEGQPKSPSRFPLPGRGSHSNQPTSPAVPRPFKPAGSEEALASVQPTGASATPSAEPPVSAEVAAGPAITVTAAPVAVVAAAPSEATPAEEPIPSLPGLTLISRRAEEPKEGTPITYREFAFAVEPGLSPKDLDRYARATWEQVRTALASRTSGKFVQIALFDHHFTGRPARPPVAVLAWKDWRGDPVIQIRGAAPAAPAAAAPAPPADVGPAQPLAPAAPPAGAAVPAPVVPVPEHGVPPGGAILGAPIAPAPAASFPVPAPGSGAFPNAPAARPPSERPLASPRPLAPVETATGRRGPSEDLISELFEEMHQLRFMPDIVTGAEYVLNVLGRVLPSEGVLIHVFDINTRQFIVVRAVGPTSRNALLQRTPDTFPTFRETFRRARTLTFRNTDGEEAFRDGRWERLGITPTIALCGAVQQGGRYLGVIELANPKGGDAFHDSEINAVDYICEQFADFVASRPIILDDDAVIPRA